MILPSAGGPARAQSLQEAIDMAAAGDTVLVAPGDYARPVTMHKDITLLAGEPGEARLGGLVGSLGTAAGLVLDGSLLSEPTELVTAGSGLRIENCLFREGIRGARITGGSEDVVFLGCTFDGLIEAIRVDPGVVSFSVEGSSFTDCPVGIGGPEELPCQPGGERTPANRCPGSQCGRVELRNVEMSGGTRHLVLSGDYVVSITGSRFRNASLEAVRTGGVRLEISDSELVSTGGVGTGLRLESVSGFVRSSRVEAWERGIQVDGGECPRYSDIVLGGTLPAACDISNHTLNLVTLQPEALNANANFWGTVDCASVQTQITGQEVETVTNAGHSILIPCTETSVESGTWGRLKGRYGGRRP